MTVSLRRRFAGPMNPIISGFVAFQGGESPDLSAV